jgi:hypothetical protein
MKSLLQQIACECIHFNGIQNKTCKAGVSYLDVRDSSGKGMYKWPCHNDDNATTTCAKAEFLAAEEAQRQADELDRHLTEALDRPKRGLCMHCSARVETYVQSGHCAYAQPCGHRLGQAKAATLNKSLAKLREATP